ncbi:MAG TPA: prolyl oligopeptidase family serine peptidase [Roseiflexaceae bacterium]|nr:prolyl oligopeptidase family serine peptidase [Roseiflexaceae bacterium]
MPTGRIGEIPLLWEEPTAPGERRLVIWLPGFTSSKEAVHRYLRELAAAGYLALSYDPVDHGERSRTAEGEVFAPDSGAFRDPATGKAYRHFWAILAETADEAPAVIDWAIATLGVAPPMGMGGISMGGNIAVVAAGIDRRIAAVAAGIAEADWLRPGSTIPLSAPNAYVQSCYDRCDPLTNLHRYQHRPAITFQLGADDTLIPPGGAQRFVRALGPTYADSSERIEAVLEEGVGHEFTEGMWQRSLRWFARFV